MEHAPEALNIFQSNAQHAMGEDEHAKRINFTELTEDDRRLYELYKGEQLGAEQIKEAVQAASMAEQVSSAFFRGWLASRVNVQLLRREMKKR